MSLYIPRLRRAVSDFLQLPLQDTTIAFEIIQESLYDARTVNSVYHLLIAQASREPFSPFLVEKSVCFMRRHLFRFPPSSETLLCISQFCALAVKTSGTRGFQDRPALQRSLYFLQALVDQLIADSQLVSANSQSSDDLTSSLKPSTLASARSWELGMNGMSESENGDLNHLGQSGRLGSTASGLQPASSIGAMSSHSLENFVRRTKTPVGAPVTPARRTESSTTKAMWMSSVGSGVPMTNDSQMHRRSRSDSVAEQFVQEVLKFRPPLIWMPNGTNRNQTDGEDDSWQSVTSMRGLMCTDHLWTVASLQLRQGSGEVRRTGSNAMGSGPLFQYRNYEQQESLQLTSKDISVVVDTVCRSQKSSEESIWGEIDAQEIWSSETAKSIGEACVTILIKLIMDLYLEHGPSVSYVLVLQMLGESLNNADPSVRARAFDVVYNLSLHSLMMSNTSDAALFEKTDQPESSEKGISKHQSRDLNSPEKSTTRKLHTLQEETESSTQPCSAENQDPLLHLMPWVRSLLFDLMTLMAQLDERDVSVWSAAIACFIHMTTAHGEFQIHTLHNFPVSVLAKALRICLESGWSDEIYSHLLRLLVKLLYLPGKVVNETRLMQSGGIEEMILHLRTTRSMLDASLLVQLIIDHTSHKTSSHPLPTDHAEVDVVDYSAEAVAPLLSNLLSASAMDVIVARCRHGEKGIGDILQVALQNCIIEKNALLDSPKKPVHHRYKSQSSFLSSDTPTSIQPGVDPEALDSWKAILDEIDSILCGPVQGRHDRGSAQLGDPIQPESATWERLRVYLMSERHEERLLGMRWVRDYSMGQLQHRLLKEDRSQLSLLPGPSAEEAEGEGEILGKILRGWLTLSDDRVGVEMAFLVDELVSRLVTLSQPLTQEALPTRTVVHRLGTILFQTLHSTLHWIRLLPAASRRRPLMSMSFQVCQIVHAPHIISDLSSTPPMDGLASLPGPFVYNDYIFGTGSVYIRLLRLAPIDFLLDLISDLEQYCPLYHDEIGFHGRPGHRGEAKSGPTNVPWTDTVSDLRSALVLLLLHRCSMDPKAKTRLESICTSLLSDGDVRVCYVASRHLLKYIMEEKSAQCRAALRQFVAKAQQMNNERLVDNPYLQVKHILESDLHPNHSS